MKNWILLFSVFALNLANAQENNNTDEIQKLELKKIAFMGGLTFSSFIFDDTQISINNQYEYKADASLGLNFEFETNRHLLRPELMYRRTGAFSTINDTKLSWSLSYLDLNLAYLYRVLDNEKFKIATGLSVGAGYMMDGKQYIGQTLYEANDEGFLNRFDLCANFLLNFNFSLSSKVDLFAEYRFGLSLLNLEKDDNQSTRNMFHVIGLGLAFNIAE